MLPSAACSPWFSPLIYGRVGEVGPRAISALLAIAGLVALYIVPNLKYPANPPSVGDPATIGMRTALYFLMMAISLAAMIGSVTLGRRLRAGYGAWNAYLTAAAVYLVVVIAVSLLLPSVNEVPGNSRRSCCGSSGSPRWGRN